jgi:ubiquinone/menaquinone biosynthesis C-methylase UbiE
MSRLEAAFCSSRLWDLIAQKAILPWSLGGAPLGDASALEVGGGDGSMAAQLLRREPRMRLTMLDIDPEMVERARRTLAPFGERAQVGQGDVTALPFDDHAFDAGISFLMLHHVDRWERAVEELIRVVKPGGRLFVYDLLDARVNRWAHQVTRSPGVRLLSNGDVRQLAGGDRLADVDVGTTAGLAFRLRAVRS